MKREEVRDQLLAPLLHWTRLGRQLNQGLLASAEVAAQSSYGLWRGRAPIAERDCEELMRMTRENVGASLEGTAAMMTLLPSESAKFWTRTAQAMAACAGAAAASLASSRNGEDLQARQKQFGATLVGSALAWYQLYAMAAKLTEAGVAPLLRQVKDNAQRSR